MAKVIIKFLIIFIVAYAVMTVPQTGISDLYAKFLRMEGNFFFGEFGEKGMVLFEPNEDKHSWNYPTMMILFNRDQYDNAAKTGANLTYVKHNLAMYYDFLFAAFLVALVIATPLSLKRKLMALLLSVILLHVYINFTLFIEIISQFSDYPAVGVVHLSPFRLKVVKFIYPIVRVNFGTGFFVALLVWLTVCFRKEDLMRIFPSP